jgi:hypothetical protein
MIVTTTMIAIMLSITVISAAALKAAPELRVSVSQKTCGTSVTDRIGSSVATAIALVA